MIHLYVRGGGGGEGRRGMILCSGSSGISIDFGFEAQALFVSRVERCVSQRSSDAFNVSARFHVKPTFAQRHRVYSICYQSGGIKKASGSAALLARLAM